MDQNTKKYDLEERTFHFAENCRNFCMKLPKNFSNIEYCKQLVRSSGSQAANYIEANESLGAKDFLHKIRICIKESKESGLWLKLSVINQGDLLENDRATLIQESTELRRIFTAILNKSR